MQVSVFFIFSDKRNASKMRDIFTQTCFGRKWVKEIGVCFTQKCFEQKRVKLRLCGFALPALRTRTDNRHQHHKIDRICRHLQIKIKKGVKTDRHQPAQRTCPHKKPQWILYWAHLADPSKSNTFQLTQSNVNTIIHNYKNAEQEPSEFGKISIK